MERRRWSFADPSWEHCMCVRVGWVFVRVTALINAACWQLSVIVWLHLPWNANIKPQARKHTHIRARILSHTTPRVEDPSPRGKTDTDNGKQWEDRERCPILNIHLFLQLPTPLSISVIAPHEWWKEGVESRERKEGKTKKQEACSSNGEAEQELSSRECSMIIWLILSPILVAFFWLLDKTHNDILR